LIPDDYDTIAALRRTTSSLVSDALDHVGVRKHTLDPAIRPLVSGAVLAGRAFPIVVVESDVIAEEPYAAEMRALDSLRPGDVPVYAVAPGIESALWGELFTCAAMGREAAGVVVDGLIRDARRMRELDFPVFARGFSPLDTLGRSEVADYGVAASCGGVAVEVGDYVVADDDGIVLIPAAAVDEVLVLVEAKERDEGRARKDLLEGVSILEVWDRYGVM